MHIASKTSSPDRDLRRIAVVGRAGAGKTTIARELADRLGLPLVHLDTLFWTAAWQEVEPEVFEAAQAAAVAGERWVIDGGYLTSRGWAARLARADLVVVAEAPLLVCLWRVLRRSLRRDRPRPDRPPGAQEQLSPYFLWWVATWSRRHPHLAARLEADGHPVVVVRRLRDLETIAPPVRPPS